MDSFNVKYKSYDVVDESQKSELVDSLSDDLIADILTKRDLIVLIAGKESKRNNKELLEYATDHKLTDDESHFRTKKDIRQWLLHYKIQELYTHASNLKLKPDPSLSKSISENETSLSLSRKIRRFIFRRK